MELLTLDDLHRSGRSIEVARMAGRRTIDRLFAAVTTPGRVDLLPVLVRQLEGCELVAARAMAELARAERTMFEIERLRLPAYLGLVLHRLLQPRQRHFLMRLVPLVVLIEPELGRRVAVGSGAH